MNVRLSRILFASALYQRLQIMQSQAGKASGGTLELKPTSSPGTVLLIAPKAPEEQEMRGALGHKEFSCWLLSHRKCLQ